MEEWQYSKSSIINELKQKGIHLTKARGQNFLLDKNILRKMINNIDLNSDCIIEIGPGIGSLTNFLIKLEKDLVLVEIDKKLYEFIEENYSLNDNMRVFNEDFLKSDVENLIKPHKKAVIIANIPYNITSKIIERCFIYSNVLSDLYILMQKEVAERIISKEGSKTYGSLSVFVQTFSMVEILFNVSCNVFFPKPKVDSSFVHFSLKNLSENIPIKDFGNFLKKIFSLRRKNIYGIVYKYLFAERINKMDIEKMLIKASIKPTSRPEVISVEGFHRLWEYYNDYSNSNKN